MSGLRKKLFKSQNLSLKIISLILAISLELYFYSPDNSATADISATIELLDVPTTLVSISPSLESSQLSAKVRIRGPRPLIEKAQKGIYSFTVNFPPNAPLAFNSKLNPDDLGLPNGIDIIDIEPNTVTFEFEKIIHKKVPIEIAKTNSLPKGYYLDKEVVVPDTVIVSGPSSLVDSLKKIYTQEINLAEISAEKKLELGLNTPNKLLKLNINTVNVELNAMLFITQWKFEKVNIKLIAPNGYAGTVEPSKADVILIGPKSDLELLKSTKVELIADTRTVRKGKHEVGLRAELPEGVKILSVEPEKVTVNLTKQ